MLTKPTIAHKCTKVLHTINIVCLLHISDRLMAISREMHYTKGRSKKLQIFENQPTDARYCFSNILFKKTHLKCKIQTNFRDN
jgi:hypothetical protein